MTGDGRYIEAPHEWNGDGYGLFLAGGITGCPDWQTHAADLLLADTDLVVLNPRRANFPIGDPGAADGQIKWEYRHLRMAAARLFWFPAESLCPIVLFELGAWTRTPEPLFVATDPDYQRRQDVVIQTGLARPDVVVLDNLDGLCEQVIRWARRT